MNLTLNETTYIHILSHSLYLAGTDVVLPYRVVCARGCRLYLFAVTVCGVGFTGVSSGLVGSGSVGVGLVVFIGFGMLVGSMPGIGAFLGRTCSRVRCSCFPSRSTSTFLVLHRLVALQRFLAPIPS